MSLVAAIISQKKRTLVEMVQIHLNEGEQLMSIVVQFKKSFYSVRKYVLKYGNLSLISFNAYFRSMRPLF